MIKLSFKVKSKTGETYTNTEILDDDYMISRKNPEFMKLVENNIEKSHLEEIESVKVTANFGEI